MALGRDRWRINEITVNDMPAQIDALM